MARAWMVVGPFASVLTRFGAVKVPSSASKLLRDGMGQFQADCCEKKLTLAELLG